jgi:selenocysteine-specific elongation factor
MVRVADLAAMGVALDPAAEQAAAASGWLIDDARADRLAGRLVAALAAHEAANPLDPGLPLQAAQRAVGLPDPALLDVLLRRRAAAGLTVEAGRVRRASSGTLPTGLRTALAALRADLAASPFGAPSADRLRELGLGPRELATLVRAGELLRVADGIYLLPGAEAAALSRLAELPSPFTLSQARQALGTTRRVAVPLLELLGRAGHTARTEDGTHRLL